MFKNNLGNKEIMAKNIKEQLEKRRITPKDLSRDLDFGYSTVLDWVNARTYPRIDKIELMARYFNIDKSDLIEEPAIKEETIDLKDVLNRTVAFDGHTLDDNDAELIKSLLENMVKNKD